MDMDVVKELKMENTTLPRPGHGVHDLGVGPSCRLWSRPGPVDPDRNRGGPNQDLDPLDDQNHVNVSHPVRRVFRLSIVRACQILVH